MPNRRKRKYHLSQRDGGYIVYGTTGKRVEIAGMEIRLVERFLLELILLEFLKNSLGAFSTCDN